jgi:hypothetical protein
MSAPVPVSVCSPYLRTRAESLSVRVVERRERHSKAAQRVHEQSPTPPQHGACTHQNDGSAPTRRGSAGIIVVRFMAVMRLPLASNLT